MVKEYKESKERDERRRDERRCGLKASGPLRD